MVDYTGDITEQVLALAAVRKGGTVVSALGAADEQTLAGAGLNGSKVNACPVREVIAALAEQVAAGTLLAEIGTVLSLEQAGRPANRVT